MRIGFQGELGAYSEIAVHRYGEVHRVNVDPIPCRTMDDLVSAVLYGAVEAGVIPVENSIVGPVTEGQAAAHTPQLRVVWEVRVPIHHCLLTLSGVSLEQLKDVESHPVALAQCQKFFLAHPHLTPRPVYDTAGAARSLSLRKDPHMAAIAGRHAAERYGLAVLREGIEDQADNHTRFVVVR